jgi:CheY-like chemotaxis protein
VGIPAVEVDKVVLQPGAVAKVPIALARRYVILPIALQGEQLHLAMADPLDETVRREVEVGTRCSVLPYIALHDRIQARLDANYQRIGATPVPPGGDAVLTLPVVTGNVPLPLTVSGFEVIDDSAIIGEPTEAFVGSSDIIVVGHPDKKVRQEIFSALTQTNCTLLAAADGRTALSLIKEHRPRMVILNALMPEVEGFEICRKMKSSRRFGGIPVLLIGAPIAAWQGGAKPNNYGADCVLESPMSLSEVSKQATRLLAEQPAAGDFTSNNTEQFDTAYFAGVEALESGNVVAALESFRRAESVDPLAAKTHYMLGRALEENGEPLKAIYHFERATMLNPRLFPALKQLAQLYQLHGFRQKATETWQLAIQASPTNEVRRQITIYLDSVGKDA